MTTSVPAAPVSRLRQRLIDDMNMRRFSPTTQRNYLRDVGRLATYLGRPPDTATAEDLRLFQIEQRDAGVPLPTMNSIVAALRFFFTHTVDRPDLARRLVRVAYPRKLPVVLSRDEVARLLNATTCLKHQAALSVAYGSGLRVSEVSMLKVRDVDSERMLLSSTLYIMRRSRGLQPYARGGRAGFCAVSGVAASVGKCRRPTGQDGRHRWRR